jgi:hypothetical protein
MAMDRDRPARPDRSKIDLTDEDMAKYWCKHFGIERRELEQLVEKTGNSAAAVRKELGARPVEIT